MKISEKFGALKHGLCIAAFFIFSGICVFAEDLRVRISPNRVTENQMAHYNIYTESGEKLENMSFPQVDGLTWHPNVKGSQTTINNGKVTNSVSIGFTVSRTGEIVIPKIRVKTSEGERFTQAVKINVGKLSTGMFREDGSEMPLSEAVFLIVQPTERDRKTYFVGEEIPVYVIALSRPDIDVSLTAAPQLVGNASDFVAAERGATRQQLNFQNEPYNASIFLFDLRAMKTGKFDIGFSANASCLIGGEEDPFESAFFGGRIRMGGFGISGGNRVSVPLKGDLKEITILPRPPVPAGVIDLGIISETQPEWTLSSDTPKQGDPLYLDLTITGNSSGLIAPEPQIDGFRTYPAEISAIDQTKTRVRMMLIPLKVGEQKLSLRFATLNPQTQEYMITQVEDTLQVEKNTSIAAPASTSAVVFEDTTSDSRFPEENPIPQTIAYIRPLNAKMLEKGKNPPGKNLWMPIAGTLITFLACFGIMIFRSGDKRNDPANALRKRARNRKGELLQKLADSTPENFDALVRNEISDYLADAKGLTSPDAVRREIQKNNPKLAEVLDAAESAGYRPNARCEHFEKFREIVRKAVKTGAFLIATGMLCCFAPQTAKAENTPVAPEQKILEAENAYASGNFEKAREGFAELTKIAPYAPDAWFNLGNALYQQKKFAPALACYERAWRLDVGRSDILTNLNATRVKLNLPQLNEVKNPADFFIVLRDSFSPFCWLLFACGTLSAGMIVFTLCRKKRIVTIAVSLACFGFGIANFFCQQKALRDNSVALVVTDNAVVYNLPIKNNTAVQELSTLPAGTQVSILETREGWFLIRFANGAEGWTESRALARLWE